MNKAEATKDFQKNHLPGVKKLHDTGTKINYQARAVAWSMYLKGLYAKDKITSKQFSTWGIPSFCGGREEMPCKECGATIIRVPSGMCDHCEEVTPAPVVELAEFGGFMEGGALYARTRDLRGVVRVLTYENPTPAWRFIVTARNELKAVVMDKTRKRQGLNNAKQEVVKTQQGELTPFGRALLVLVLETEVMQLIELMHRDGLNG